MSYNRYDDLEELEKVLLNMGYNPEDPISLEELEESGECVEEIQDILDRMCIDLHDLPYLYWHR